MERVKTETFLPLACSVRFLFPKYKSEEIIFYEAKRVVLRDEKNYGIRT